MTDDDVRHVLTAYAATTPDLDPRAGLPERLARRGRQRRAVLAVTACVAVVVAGTGMAMLTRDPGGRAELVVADDGPSGTPSGPAEPTERPSPSGSAEPSPEASVPPASESPPSAPSRPSGPPPAGPPVTAKGHGSGGLTATVTLAAGRIGTATAVRLSVDASDDDGHPYVASVAWGDGRHERIFVAVADCVRPAPLPAAHPKDPGESSDAFEHAWRTPGTYTVEVTVRSGHECQDDPRHEIAHVSLGIEVLPWLDLSNGPAEPKALYTSVRFMDETSDEGYWYDYLAEASVTDDDGYVRSITFDWGDGSEPDTYVNEEACDDGDGKRYPTSTFAANEQHDYGGPGDWVLTISWETAGCDGEDVQRGSERLRVEATPVD